MSGCAFESGPSIEGEASERIARDEAWGPREDMIFDGTSGLVITVFNLGKTATRRLTYTCHPVMTRNFAERVNEELQSASGSPLYIQRP